MDIPLIVQLVAGVIGGNLIGGIARRISLGFLGNSLIGIIGAFTAFQVGLMEMAGLDFGTLETYVSQYDAGELLNRGAGGVLGGAIVMTVFGLAKGALVSK